jgi:hypothetical protein
MIQRDIFLTFSHNLNGFLRVSCLASSENRCNLPESETKLSFVCSFPHMGYCADDIGLLNISSVSAQCPVMKPEFHLRKYFVIGKHQLFIKFQVFDTAEYEIF